jgi:hypothetical protein
MQIVIMNTKYVSIQSYEFIHIYIYIENADIRVFMFIFCNRNSIMQVVPSTSNQSKLKIQL